MKNLKREQILDTYSDETFLFADGFDEAILGVDSMSMRVIYSVLKSLKVLKKQGMSEDEAIEYFDFNVIGAYVGEKTPIWCQDDL